MQNCDILLTPAALARLAQLAATGTRVRLSVEAGGCAGFQRKFIPSTPETDDICLGPVAHGLLLDPVSASLIKGATVDFQNDLSAQQFTLTIPQATSGCGCGASFNLPE